MTYMTHPSGYSTMQSIDMAVSSNYNTHAPAPINTLESVVQYQEPVQIIEDNSPGLGAMQGMETYHELPKNYGGSAKQKDYTSSIQKSKPVYHSPETFLKPNRPVTQFVGKTEDIKEYIEEAFTATTGKSLQDLNIVIDIVPEQKFKKLFENFGGSWNKGIQGFSVNHEGRQPSLVIVKEEDLDKVMITVGHEIGHVMAKRLDNKIDEEAKAFAFELAWINALFTENIAGLRASLNVTPQPANNGVHDVGFNFVLKQLMHDQEPLDVFDALSRKEISVEEQ